jgi:hypothetical protein
MRCSLRFRLADLLSQLAAPWGCLLSTCMKNVQGFIDPDLRYAPLRSGRLESQLTTNQLESATEKELA